MAYLGGAYKIGDQSGVYFITFSVVEWVDVFTRIDYADIFINSLNFCISKKGLHVFAWVLMPNHFHMIAKAKDGCNLSGIIRDLKKYTSVRIVEAIEQNNKESRKGWMLWLFSTAGKRNSNNINHQFWQQNNHPEELFSGKMIEQKLRYIHQNPVKAGLVFEEQNYRYSSAIDYSGGKGLVEIEFVS